MRDALIRWVMAKAGIGLGQILPWWLQALVWVLWPVEVTCLRAAERVYSPMRHAVKVNGVWLPLFACRWLAEPSGDRWHRVVSVDDGVVTMESRSSLEIAAGQLGEQDDWLSPEALGNVFGTRAALANYAKPSIMAGVQVANAPASLEKTSPPA